MNVYKKGRRKSESDVMERLYSIHEFLYNRSERTDRRIRKDDVKKVISSVMGITSSRAINGYLKKLKYMDLIVPFLNAREKDLRKITSYWIKPFSQSCPITYEYIKQENESIRQDKIEKNLSESIENKQVPKYELTDEEKAILEG